MEKENITYAVKEDGKDTFVLCPYRWFEENWPEEEGCVANSAIRKELTAEYENADTVRQFIWNHYAAFDDYTLAAAVKNIDYYLTSSLFQVSNAAEWRSLRTALDNRESHKGACP